jgi:hypothetical protein
MDFVEQARSGLQFVVRFLEHPNAAGLDNARRCLQVVIGQLQTCQAMMRDTRHNTPELRGALPALAAEVAHVNVMFREAGVLFGGWKRVLSARLGGYTRHGRPAQLRCRQHVMVRI